MNEEAHGPLTEWTNRPLASVIEHIIATHHAFCRQEASSIPLTFKKALDAHKKEHPELIRMQLLFFKMSKDLAMHLLKEEETLFPYIERVEDATSKGSAISWPPFGTVGNPIRMMVMEHDQTEEELKEIRELSHGYAPPADASEPLVALYQALASFDRDMQRHIDIENDVLFPRAVALEDKACAKH